MRKLSTLNFLVGKGKGAEVMTYTRGLPDVTKVGVIFAGLQYDTTIVFFFMIKRFEVGRL